MAVPIETQAPGLSERAAFTLLHCDRPMTYRGGRSTWQGKFPEGTSTLENAYRCDGCGATLGVKLVEPDQADPSTSA
jgi:hypothetical protein